MRREERMREIERLESDLATYRHTFETTAADRDRLRTELDELRGMTVADKIPNSGDLAPRVAAGRPQIPTLFFVTMPKSATLYLMKLFTEGLGIRYMHASLNSFPTDLLELSRVQGIRSGNCYSTAHLNPSTTNLQMLDHFFGRFVLHLRDPRQALWSWVHYVDKLIEDGKG